MDIVEFDWRLLAGSKAFPAEDRKFRFSDAASPAFEILKFRISKMSLPAAQQEVNRDWVKRLLSEFLPVVAFKS